MTIERNIPFDNVSKARIWRNLTDIDINYARDRNIFSYEFFKTNCGRKEYISEQTFRER